jgi:terminase small subunit-like protein
VLAISLDGAGDIVIDGAGKAMIDHANVQRARLAADSIKWLVGKWAPRTYGDKPQAEEQSQALTIQWQANDAPASEPPPAPREPPRQLVYRKPEMPADLSPADWSVLMQLLALLKRTLPSNSESVPAEIFDLIRKTLLAHFRETENV